MLCYAQLLGCVRLFCDTRDCSPTGTSVHGISQARILEWVAISSCRGSSRSGVKPTSPALVGGLSLSHQSAPINKYFSQLSCSVMSDSLRPHGLQHAVFNKYLITWISFYLYFIIYFKPFPTLNSI